MFAVRQPHSKIKIRLVRNPRFIAWSAAARPDGYPDVIDFRYGYSSDAAVRAVETEPLT